MRVYLKLLLVAMGFLLMTDKAIGQVTGHVREFAPGVGYDASIPTMKMVLGHEPGERVTTPEEIGRYLRALRDAAPDRTRLIRYGESWERRELQALIIGNAERMGRIDEVKAGLGRLATGTTENLETLVRGLPVVVALIHGVHGNEISSGEAALFEAYHLLAAQGDPLVDRIRREALVIIDPMENPDGRARFVSQNLLGAAATPDPEPLAAEHDEPWPGGRSNHYLFDLNRDWFAQTQPESRGRVELLLDWMPQVVVDLHEMGGDSTYYFPPAAAPLNPHLTATQSGWLEKFGRATGRRFDERGFEYFNREVFDAFYPGYGVSWPTTQGAIGMTFEKASARGLVWRRRDGTLLTYRDGAVEHFTAALSTLATAVENRERLLRDFAEFRRTAGQGSIRAYLLPDDQDRGQLRRLVRTLLRNGIRVRRALDAFNLDGRVFPAGTWIVPLPQPAGMLVRNLLDPQVAMSEDFLRRQEARRRDRLSDQIYDITSWNLPLLYDLVCIGTPGNITVRATDVRLDGLNPEPFAGGIPPEPVAGGIPPEPVAGGIPPKPVAGGIPPEPVAGGIPEATVGYALKWNAAAAAVTIGALRAGYRARFLAEDFTIEQNGAAGTGIPQTFRHGTVIFRRADNGPQLKESLVALAREWDATIIPLESAFVSEGISPGSNQSVPLHLPRVLLLWDAPANSLSAGWSRYILEQRYGQPVTAVRVSSLARLDLRRFDVVIAPSGSYGSSLSGEPLRRLRDWIAGGGTLITLGEASRWAAAESTGLLGTTLPLRAGSAETVPAGGPLSAGALPARPDAPPPLTPFEQAIRPTREMPESIPGSILRVLLDEGHWLSSGTDLEIQAMVEGNRVFAPIRLDKGRNVGVYAARERLLVSGILWPGAAAQLAQSAFLIHQPIGEGHVIAFAEDPNYRAFAETTQFLLINAVLLGPGY
jgi:hypothetical protein